MKKIEVGKKYSLTLKTAKYVSDKACISLEDLLVLITPRKCILIEDLSNNYRTVYRIKFQGQRHAWLYRKEVLEVFEEVPDLKQEEMEL